MAENKHEELLKQIESMTVLELSEFVKALEEKFGVSAAQFAAAPAAAVAGGEAAEAEEKTNFDVVLTDVGGNKIQVIKAVKDVTGKGLKEAKDMTDNLPATVKEGAPKEEAEDLKNKLVEAGATVELK